MPLEDLDLEFEDEEELKKKRNEAVSVDVDSLFEPIEPAAKPAAAAPAAVGKPAASAAAARPGEAQVKKLDDARAAQAAKRPGAAPVASAPARPTVSGANALQTAPGDEAMADLASTIEETRFEARVQVAVAEHRLELLADVLSDAKLLDHQVHQLLVRINQKHPDLKPEVMAIKKLLADFAAKKRK